MNIYDILRQEPEIWDLFTRKEEYDDPIRDKYGRFPYWASRHRDIFKPKVSEYLIKQGLRFEYPDDAPFAVCFTHDIDVVYKSVPSKGFTAIKALKQSNLSQSIHSLSQMRSRKNPFCNFKEIMDLEERYGAKSTFFFMAEEPGEQDYAYNIEDLESEIGEIIDQGWEVGLHGGHSTYLDPSMMQKKKERLERVTGKPVIGYRNHFLRFRVPDTWKYLSQAGFKYDSTFGYADCAGFRNGMCHPFRPFDLHTGREIDIVEIPLNVMDGTLDQGYMRLDPGKAIEVIQRLIDEIERCHGIITILWHNTYFFDDKAKFYKKILKYCMERRAWMTNGKEICEWFDNGLRIRG